MLASTMTTNENSTLALEIATKASQLLKRYGEVSLLYVTAEFEPYTSQFKPDILFIPEKGPNVGEVYFVELATYRPRRVEKNYATVLPMHRDFVLESSDANLMRYAFATNERIEPGIKMLLSSSQIKIFDQIANAEQLAKEIILWSKVN